MKQRATRSPQKLNFRHEHFVPTPTTVLHHPDTGASHFGAFPEIHRHGERFPAGQIVVKYGEHWGPNHGYGVHHILQEHRSITFGHPNSVEAILRFIDSILMPGNAIHCEFTSLRGKHKPLVVSQRRGYVVLQPTDDSHIHQYSVVTAVPNGNAKGPRIGAL